MPDSLAFRLNAIRRVAPVDEALALVRANIQRVRAGGHLDDDVLRAVSTLRSEAYK